MPEDRGVCSDPRTLHAAGGQILNSAGVSENGSSDNHRQSQRSTNAHKDGPTPECRSGVVKLLFWATHSPLSFCRL